MKSHYPTSFDHLRAWAGENNISLDEARTRFAQYGVLRAIATSNTLHSILVFKGGNALDFVWQPNRSTRDLDFSLDTSTCDSRSTDDFLCGLLTPALNISSRILGIAYKIHRLQQQPPGQNRNFITYEVRIGYALPDEAVLRARMEEGKPSTKIIKIEISENEPICAYASIDVGGPHQLRVCTLEDIVAEKLRALLQQSIRNRTRRQDLLDIAVILRAGTPIDLKLVTRYLQLKAKARGVPVSRSAFHEDDLVKRARQDYDALKETTRKIFIPFEEALQMLFNLVDYLEIPE